jgi:hypothetical protein
MSATPWALIVVLGLGAQACGGSTEFDRSKSEEDPPPCNDLEVTDVVPSCVAADEIPAPTGGKIADGAYVLVGYSTPTCNFGFKRTSRITSISDDTYQLELVIEHYGPANATFVTSGTTITSTYTCGGGEDPPLEYAIEDGPDAYRFTVIDESTAFFFERFGD